MIQYLLSKTMENIVKYKIKVIIAGLVDNLIRKGVWVSG